MNKYAILRRINGKDKAIALITVAAMALAVAILSVMFFVRENNQAFYDHQAQVLIGCDMRIDIATKAGQPAIPTAEEQQFLDDLAAQGYVVEELRYAQASFRTANIYESYVFKISDHGLPSKEACILSDVAAGWLALGPGDQLTIEGLDQVWEVLRVEPLMMTDYRVNALGIIVIHPDSSAALLKSQGIDSLTDLRLTIKITAPEGKASELEDAVRTAFPYTPFSPDGDRELRAMNVEEQLAEQKMVLAVVEMVLLVLSMLSFILSAAGILALAHLRTVQHRASFTLLRVYGMTGRDGILCALYESTLFALPANAVGVFAGYVIFRDIVRQMTGVTPSFSVANSIFFITVAKTLVLSGAAMFLCLLWSYRGLFATEIMDMRRERQPARRRRLGSALYMGMCAFIFALLCATALNIGGPQTVIPLSMGMSLGLNLGIIAVFGLLLLVLYGLFRLLMTLLRILRVPLHGIGTLGYRLVLKRKTYTSLIGTALITGLTMLLVMYNVSIGIDTYFERIWQDVLGYSASAESYDGSDIQTLLDEHGFNYATVYRKLFYATNMPEGTNAGPHYQVAVIDNSADSSIGMRVEPGTFLANEHFLFCEQLEVGDTYRFFEDIPLQCVEEISNLHTTGGISTVTFSTVLSYADAHEYLDETYSKAYLLDLTNEEIKRLTALGSQHGFIVTTAKIYADGLRMAYAEYVVLIYLICVLLGLTVMVFIFSLTYVVVWTRRREFTIYKAFGASQRQVEGIVLMENLFIAVIAAIVTTALGAGIFKLVLESLMFGGIPYNMPIWAVIGTVLCAVLLASAISLGVVKAFQFGEPTETLRAQE